MFLQVKSLSEVQEFLANWPVNPRVERIEIAKACGRVAFKDIYAPFSLPPFDKSLMDGYAVMSQDTFSASEKEPVILHVREGINAGDTSHYPLRRGWAAYVATGAGIPKHADGVIMVEYTKRIRNKVSVMKGVSVGEYILTAGSDFKKSDLLLKAGTKMTPRHLGLLSAFGIHILDVYRKPRVAIISSGNEIVKAGGRLGKAKVFDINGPTLSAYVEQWGAHAHFLGIARDEKKSIRKMIIEAKKYDLILFSAGASAGSRDLVSSVLEEMGKVFIHGIAVKPGKPTLIAGVGRKLVFGLPGNPTSCLMMFFIFVLPFLARLTGERSKFKKLRFKSAHRIACAKGKKQFISVRIKDGMAHSIDKGSGAYSTFSDAEGFAVIPEDVEYVEKGDMMDVIVFGDEHD
jgi:molybdopterin molybdotransferase